jgi:hypothetical protein
MNKIPKKGEVYQGRIYDDIFVRVESVSIGKNTVYGTVIETGVTLDYILSDFDRYYKLASTP